MKARGTGRLYLRKYNDRSIWWIEYWHHGVQHRESARSEVRADAARLLKKRLGEIGRGRLIGPDAERLLYDDLEVMLLEDLDGKACVPATKRRLAHLRRFFAEKPALEITKDVMTSYKVRRLKEPRSSPATVKMELAWLHRMFVLAVEAERLDRMPAFPTISVDNARQGFATQEQIERVIRHLPRHARAPVRFAFLTGWRGKEIRSLTWAAVDFAEGTVRLEAAQTKTRRPRVFPFRALPALVELLQQQREQTTALEHKQGRIVPWVFHRGGEPLGSFRTAWRRAVRDAGVPGLRPHDLRRSAARNLVRAGVPEADVMRLCGWRTRAMFDRYNVAGDRDLEQSVERLDAYLGGKTRTFPARSAVGGPAEAPVSPSEEMELVIGIEPMTPSLRVTCSTS